jgi:DNA-binding transcriptional LysR family regulator
MDLLSACETFLRVAETGSFSLAAIDRARTQPAVSRQIVALEKHLDARLVHRTTNGITLTEEGRRAIPLMLQLIEAADALRDSVRGSAQQVSGKVRLSVPAPLGLFISSHISVLLEHHPFLQVELVFSEGASDMISAGLDIEVRLGDPEDSSLISRRLGWTTAYLVAAPSYLARHPAPSVPGEIAGHDCIAYARAGDPRIWRFNHRGSDVVIPVNARLQATNAVAVHRAAVAGAGLAILSHILAEPCIKAGRLVHLMPDFLPARLPIVAVYPSRHHMPMRVKTVLDFLTAIVQQDIAMQEDKPL